MPQPHTSEFRRVKDADKIGPEVCFWTIKPLSSKCLQPAYQTVNHQDFLGAVGGPPSIFVWQILDFEVAGASPPRKWVELRDAARTAVETATLGGQNENCYFRPKHLDT